MRGLGSARVYMCIFAAVAAFAVYALTLRTEKEAFVGAGGRETRDISLGGAQNFFVSMGARDTRYAAACESARYAERGAAGAVYYYEGGYIMLGASFADYADARAVCESLRRNENIDSEVISVKTPSITARVTADSARLDAVEGAVSAIGEYIAALEALSVSSDSAGDVGAARALAEVELTRITRAGELLRLATLDSQNEFCLGLLDITLSARADLQAALSEDIGFDSALRSCAVSARLSFIEFCENIR